MSQPNRRFWNSGQDGEIMSHVHEIEIKLMKLENGRVAGMFKMCGSFGDDFLDEDFSAERADPAETARFCRKLLQMFDGGRPPGACC